MIEQKKDCSNCLNRCMDMDMDPYCYSEGWMFVRLSRLGHEVDDA
jgi:hypothetical protein